MTSIDQSHRNKLDHIESYITLIKKTSYDIYKFIHTIQIITLIQNNKIQV